MLGCEPALRMTMTGNHKSGAYGTKEACSGSWLAPLTGTMHIKPSAQEYYNHAKAKPYAGWRGMCQVCKKECAIRTDGTVGAHVNTPLSRKTKREAVKITIQNAKTDLLALRNELLSEGNT